MSSPSKSTRPSPLSPTAASSSPVPHEEGGVPLTEDEEDVDQLAFTLDSPLRPQLEFFEKVFNTGKPLAASWTIPVDLWRRYDALLHECTSSTTALMELNMLDDSDALDRDHQELSQFLDTQRQETVAASKRRHTSSPVRPGGATSSEAPAKTSHKRYRHLFPPTLLPSIVPRSVHLVLPPRWSPPSQPPVASTTSLHSPSHAPVMAVDSDPLADAGIRRLPVPADHPGLVQGPTGLVRLAAVAEQRAGADQSPSSGIKGTSQDLLSSNMPPSRSRLIPHSHTTHPYRVENERLSSRVQDPEAQLAESQLENSALTSAFSATGCGAIADLPAGGYTAGVGVLSSLGTVPCSGEGSPRASRAVERLRDVQEELLSAREEKEVAEGHCSSSAHRNSELQASIVQHQGLVDESNALAARQRQGIETLQEEVHQFRDCASFLERMVREFPEEGFYEVSLPPVSELEEELTCGLDSTDPNLIVRNFQLVLEYLQASRGIHGELHVRTLSTLHWFFDNAADQDDDDSPFLTIAQHAGYAPPFESALEPPLHCHMFALDTALPYHGAG
ncbi:hypothetical protein EV368DRAFT_70412, partial [Lentinula lateritia]